MEYQQLTTLLDRALGVGRSFDVAKRECHTAGGFSISFYTISGFVHEINAENLLAYVLEARDPENCLYHLPHHEVQYSDDIQKLTDFALSGRAVLCVEHTETAAIIDIKSYPQRSIEEPENDRVLRGPRDGFGESLVRNTSLIRRRLRDSRFIIEKITVGNQTKCDVALCYMDTRADSSFVDKMRDKLNHIHVDALNMTVQSLSECLIHRGWYNPFPKIRFSERPDSCAAMIEEGSVILLVDNSPQAMILPTSIFDFLQESDDFYFPPLVGSYLRITRMTIFLLALVLTPIWYLLVKHNAELPNWIAFINVKDPGAVPLLWQLLLAEFMIDGLKLASLNTPSMLNNSLSVVGGLILGDYAVEAGWFSPQTILYMSIVAIASFTQQSYELGYAFKFLRIILLLLAHFFDIAGVVFGLIGATVLIAANKTVVGSRSYLYPLIPFNGKALFRIFFRPRLNSRLHRNSRPTHRS